MLDVQETAKLFNVSLMTVRNWVRDGIFPRHERGVWNKIFLYHEDVNKLLSDGFRGFNNKRKWNYDFFKERNELTAYWAGFLYADGNLVKMTGHICCYLHQKDKDHVLDLAIDLGLSSDDLRIRKSGLIGIDITHQGIQADLRSWSIVPRKSYNWIEPDFPDELFPAFLCGWIDGDGYIRVQNRSYQRIYNCPQIGLSGNLGALTWCKDKLTNLGYPGKIGLYESKNKKTGHVNGILSLNGVVNFKYLFDEILCIVKYSRRLRRKWDKLEFIYNKIR